MTPAEATRLNAIRGSLLKVSRLSDSLARLGPFRIGLDGVLSWIPGIGEAYSVAAAAFILVQGVRARAPLHLLVGAGLLLALRTTITAAPLVGPIASDLFTAHRWAAGLIVRDIDRKLAGEAGAEITGQARAFA